MVLEGATNPPPTDSQPQSDDDPYASQPSQRGLQPGSPFPGRIQIDYEALKVPPSDRAHIQRNLIPRLESVAATAGRPLTPTEQQALAKHWVGIQKSVNMARTTTLLASLVLVTFVPYRMFPRGLRIFKPETINGRQFFRFPAGSQWAVAGWDSTRKTIQCLGALWIGSFIAVPFAEVTAATRAAQDPQLENLRTSMKQRVDAARAQGVDPRMQQWEGQQGQSQSDNFQRQEESQQGESSLRQEATRAAQQAYRTRDGSDDASPTAGNEPWTGSNSERPNERPSSRSRDSGYSQDSSNEWQKDSFTDSEPASTDSSLFDDASPTTPPQPASSGSSWNRLRQQAAAEKRGERQWGQSQGKDEKKSGPSNSEGGGEKWW